MAIIKLKDSPTKLIIYSQRPMDLVVPRPSSDHWCSVRMAHISVGLASALSFRLSDGARFRKANFFFLFANILIAFEGLSAGKFHSAIAY